MRDLARGIVADENYTPPRPIDPDERHRAARIAANLAAEHARAPRAVSRIVDNIWQLSPAAHAEAADVRSAAHLGRISEAWLRDLAAAEALAEGRPALVAGAQAELDRRAQLAT